MSRSAQKLFERMRGSNKGWGPRDLHTLYLGFDFKFREGAKHRVYWHPRYPMIRDTVPRHGELPLGYVSDAIKKVEQVLRNDADNPEAGGSTP